uniref:PHD-type domain-containing protein n=1 Tax=Macrostomum lignano TaxID=282301 RepID=A0A1I8F580_9PLAT
KCCRIRQSRRRLTAKDSPPVVDSIDVDVANKDEGEAASELEDGEVSPTNNNSNSNHNNSMTSQKKWLPTVLAESRDQTDRPKDQLGTQPATASVDAEQSLGRLSQFRRTVTRPCIFSGAWRSLRISQKKLKKDLAAPLAPPPPPDPYESVFDVAALEAAAGVEQLRRDRRRLHPNSRPFPPDFEATGGRLPLPLDHSSGVDIADNGRRRRQQAPAVLHHFPRCMKPFEADELHQELSSSNCMPRAASDDDDEAAVKLNWLDDSSRWPDALDKLRRQLAALLKVPFARTAVARLERPSDCTDCAQSATSKDSGDAGSSPATPLAALVFVGGPPRPVWNFAVASVRVAGSSGRLHLAATWHGGLLVAEGSAVSDWAVRRCLPSLLTGTRVLLLLLIRQPKHCLCCFLCAQRSSSTGIEFELNRLKPKCDNEEELARLLARMERTAAAAHGKTAPPSRCRAGAKKEALPRLGPDETAVVPVVITASVINEMLPNQTEPRRLTAKTRRPVVDSIDVDVANKDEGEAASELEDGEVSPTNNNSNSNHNNSMTSQKKWLPTVLAESQLDSCMTSSAMIKLDSCMSSSAMTEPRFSISRYKFSHPPAHPGTAGWRPSACPPPPPDPYESVFDVAARWKPPLASSSSDATVAGLCTRTR